MNYQIDGVYSYIIKPSKEVEIRLPVKKHYGDLVIGKSYGSISVIEESGVENKISIENGEYHIPLKSEEIFKIKNNYNVEVLIYGCYIFE